MRVLNNNATLRSVLNSLRLDPDGQGRPGSTRFDQVRLMRHFRGWHGLIGSQDANDYRDAIITTRRLPMSGSKDARVPRLMRGNWWGGGGGRIMGG